MVLGFVFFIFYIICSIIMLLCCLSGEFMDMVYVSMEFLEVIVNFLKYLSDDVCEEVVMFEEIMVFVEEFFSMIELNLEMVYGVVEFVVKVMWLIEMG